MSTVTPAPADLGVGLEVFDGHELITVTDDEQAGSRCQRFGLGEPLNQLGPDRGRDPDQRRTVLLSRLPGESGRRPE